MPSFSLNTKRPHMNRFTLSFEDGLEREFRGQFYKKTIEDVRSAAMIGLILWAFFGLLDANISPDHTRILWSIRYRIGLPAIFIAILASFLPRSGRLLQPLTALTILLVEYSVILMQKGCPGPVNLSYYAGIILVYMYGVTLLRLRFVWAFVTGNLTLALYLLHFGSGEGIPHNIQINNFFFLAGAIVIGMMAAYFIEFYNRRIFVMVSLLEREREKVVSANDRLEQRVFERTRALRLKIRDHEQAETSLRESRKRIAALSQKLVNAQEAERNRIAMELHDHVAQDLASLTINCNTIFDDESGISPKLREKAATFAERLKDTIKSLRNISYDLQPPDFVKMDLARTLHLLCEEFGAENQIAVAFSAAGMEGIHGDPDRSIHIYRLVQEALNNIKKHARATAVSVRLVAAGPHVILRVEDNGRGYNATALKTRHDRNMGIRNMETRASLLNGRFTIDSTPGTGTRICVQIPFPSLPMQEEPLQCARLG